jgi:hypothetical protein
VHHHLPDEFLLTTPVSLSSLLLLLLQLHCDLKREQVVIRISLVALISSVFLSLLGRLVSDVNWLLYPLLVLMKLAFEFSVLIPVEVSLSSHRHEFLVFQLELQLKFDNLTVQLDVGILRPNLHLLGLVLLLCGICDEM